MTARRVRNAPRDSAGRTTALERDRYQRAREAVSAAQSAGLPAEAANGWLDEGWRKVTDLGHACSRKPSRALVDEIDEVVAALRLGFSEYGMYDVDDLLPTGIRNLHDLRVRTLAHRGDITDPRPSRNS